MLKVYDDIGYESELLQKTVDILLLTLCKNQSNICSDPKSVYEAISSKKEFQTFLKNIQKNFLMYLFIM